MKRTEESAETTEDASSFSSESQRETKNKKKKKESSAKCASLSETLGFIWECGPATILIFALGIIGGLGNGLVYPALAYMFSTSFSDISGATEGGDQALDQIREVSYMFLIIGAYALVMATIQTVCFEVAADRASKNFRLKWFHALLRQDTAFFDVYDVGGIASTVGPNAHRFHKGIGRKFGEGVQFFFTGIGGIAYAFYSSWKTSLVIFAILPIISMLMLTAVQLNQTKTQRAAAAYKRAGSVAYTTVSSIKTVLSLNASSKMISQYREATEDAFLTSTGTLIKEGIANGGMLGSMMLVYCILTLYGSYLLYNDVGDSGCDPSNGIGFNASCESSGPNVFGAMLGIMFSAQALSQVSNVVETFTAGRVAVYEALKAINRKPGAAAETIFMTEEDDEESDTTESRHSQLTEDNDAEAGEGSTRATSRAPKIKAILPKYEINSLCEEECLKPNNVEGKIVFTDVHFYYPARPNKTILNGLSLEIEAGKTIALVGPSGGGKSTIVSMIERFYDPVSGTVELDDNNYKDISVPYLRNLIGYVGQEPTLFATSVRNNIRYGNPDATDEQVEAAARMSNAHDFISAFPDGYDTQVGDKGSQLSGGQKQRIAIARVLVGEPKILLLDEATSALDYESELVVQEALDNVLEQKKLTTVIVAHRLSTIRNVDVIAVVVGGKIVEKGTHAELMADVNGYYRRLVDKQEGNGKSRSVQSSREHSSGDLTELESNSCREEPNVSSDATPHIVFKEVEFAYPTRLDRKVFNGFNLSINRGETIALVGPSGGGKSTTVGLIERFYDPLAGAIEYNGIDIKLLNVHWYRDQIGYVGQEPTLFDETIGNNIAYGLPGATQETIENAAKQANAHEFISSFPDGYNTRVGERGTQLSGGQKQRVAIARALVKKPKVLILDEATSALDNDSEAVVQAALDKLMESREHTTVVIAHRLSTIRNVDRVAFIADGKVLEFGKHDELLAKKNGRFKRLCESQNRVATVESLGLSTSKQTVDETEKLDDEDDDDCASEAGEESVEFSLSRARKMATPDIAYIMMGALGAIGAGAIFPAWGILFSETMDILFQRVYSCEDWFFHNETTLIEGIRSYPLDLSDAAMEQFVIFFSPFDSCQEYWDAAAEDMRVKSFEVAAYWAVCLVGCLVFNTLLIKGIGTSSERLNKRVRDQAFAALVRQEVAFFDKRSVGSITSELQNDAAKIHAFSGEPVRSLLLALASVLTGVTISFIFMWPFALLSLVCIPLMGMATSVEMERALGTDEGHEGGGGVQDELNSPGGIAVETLLNIRTVSALTLETARLENYSDALTKENPHNVTESLKLGARSGLAMLVQQWVNGLQFFWGGWILVNYPESFGFKDFLYSNFALLFSLFGLGAAFQDMSDRKEVEKSTGRIFHLLDRKSTIDPLSEDGKKPA